MYLRVNINEKKNNIYNEIKLRINSANGCCFIMKGTFSSKLLSKRTKKCLYCTYMPPVTRARYGLAPRRNEKNKALRRKY